MGQSSAATVREIEDIRGRIEGNLRELERRMPARAVWVKRAVGIAVGGGTAAIVLTALVKKIRNRRKPAAKRARDRGTPAQTVVQVLPEGPAERIAGALEDGRWKQWAAAAGGVWLAIRLIELRQLRRVNRALVTGRA